METGGGRGLMLLVHGLWFRPSVWTPELNEAGYDCAVLPWGDGGLDFAALLRAARSHVQALGSRPIVIGHGVGAVVAERLLAEGTAAAAISLAPTPGGYPAVPTAAGLLGRRTRLALLSLRGGPVAPTFPQFRRAIANVGPDADARRLAAGGRDELIREVSTALLHRSYRRRQPDAVTDYKVFPGLDHTLSLGTPNVTVLFYCLDWLTAQNM